MKIHFHTAALTAALAVLLASPGYADQKSKSQSSQGTSASPMSFESLDVNKDRKISKKEAAKSQSLVQAWDQADTNNDGSLDRSEFSAFETSQGGQKDAPASGMESPGGAGGQQPGRQY